MRGAESAPCSLEERRTTSGCQGQVQATKSPLTCHSGAIRGQRDTVEIAMKREAEFKPL